MTKFSTKYLTLAGATVLLFVPMAAIGQNGPPPSLPTAKMAKQLGVSEGKLTSCMPSPARGQRPERPDTAAITKCLQGENTSVTQQSVAQVLEEYKPTQPPRRG